MSKIRFPVVVTSQEQVELEQWESAHGTQGKRIKIQGEKGGRSDPMKRFLVVSGSRLELHPVTQETVNRPVVFVEAAVGVVGLGAEQVNGPPDLFLGVGRSGRQGIGNRARIRRRRSPGSVSHVPVCRRRSYRDFIQDSPFEPCGDQIGFQLQSPAIRDLGQPCVAPVGVI